MDLWGIAFYSSFLFGYMVKHLVLCGMQTEQRNLLSTCRVFILMHVCKVFHTFELVSEVEVHPLHTKQYFWYIEDS